MTDQNGCYIYPLSKVILKKIATIKNQFASKKKDNKFKEKVVAIKNEKHSFDDLKNQYIEENPKWKEALISVPSIFLLKYKKKVPYYVTEEDVQGEFQKIMA